MEKIHKTEEEWRKELTDEQFRVLRKQGTERAGSGEYDHHYESGRYLCAGCGQPLFGSKEKFNSGTGWPSFYNALDKESVEELEDRSLFMRRTEVRCARCEGHLGHVFPDGPEPTGLRYCMNSAALKFEPEDDDPEK